LSKGCHKLHPILLKLVFKTALVFVKNYGVKKKKPYQRVSRFDLEKKKQCLCPGKSYI